MKTQEKTLQALRFWILICFLLILSTAIAGAWNHWLWISTTIGIILLFGVTGYATQIEIAKTIKK